MEATLHTMSKTLTKGRISETEVSVSDRQQIRVAVICDYREENWPSMDLNGDALSEQLAKDHAPEIAATQLLPPFQRRFMRVPLLRQPLGWNADRVLNRFVYYPRELRNQLGKHDLFHLVDHSYSQLLHTLPTDRTIVTCHDLDTFRCVLEPAQDHRSKWFQRMTRRVFDGFRKAAHVVCNSNSTRDQLLHYGLFPSERITVIHSGVHPAFSVPPDPSSEAEAARLLDSSSPRDIRLLSVGSTIPRKRMDVLLKVFAMVTRDFPAARLIRVGGPFTEAQLGLARELGVDKAISVLPFVSRNVLASIYRGVTLLLQTSEAEGFGMPLAEAMACGCPVVASDLKVLREIGGAACEYVPAGDLNSWRDTVVQLLQEHITQNGTQDLRHERALAQVTRYSWAENARRTVEVYRKVLRIQ
jgi:glycosyltransferase involved in cell wall biosynthesis